jgi:hypothetical protein
MNPAGKRKYTKESLLKFLKSWRYSLISLETGWKKMKFRPAWMVSRSPHCLQHGLSEIELSVKMRSSWKKTVRPYAPLLESIIEWGKRLCRIGGRKKKRQW